MRSRTLSSIAATAVMALGISLLVTGPGSAEPNKTLAQAQEELEALEIRAGTASEKFNEAEVLLAAATRRVEQARTKAAGVKAELVDRIARLADRGGVAVAVSAAQDGSAGCCG